MNAETMRWIEESVEYFQDMGFLEDGFELDKMHEYIRDAYFEEYLQREPKPEGWFPLDAQILNQDSKRVWWRDLEIDYSAQETYLEAIRRWSKISRGKFLSENIQFKWIVAHEVFEISFMAGDKLFTHKSDSTGWIDPELISKINGLLVNSGVFFYMCNTQDQSGFLVALTSSEKEKLEQERGWECYLAYDGQAG